MFHQIVVVPRLYRLKGGADKQVSEHQIESICHLYWAASISSGIPVSSVVCVMCCLFNLSQIVRQFWILQTFNAVVNSEKLADLCSCSTGDEVIEFRSVQSCWRKVAPQRLVSLQQTTFSVYERNWALCWLMMWHSNHVDSIRRLLVFIEGTQIHTCMFGEACGRW